MSYKLPFPFNIELNSRKARYIKAGIANVGKSEDQTMLESAAEFFAKNKINNVMKSNAALAAYAEAGDNLMVWDTISALREEIVCVRDLGISKIDFDIALEARKRFFERIQ